jgi:hypothetical protein
MRKRVTAILWRQANKATLDTLNGLSEGQYDIRLGADLRIAEFFQGLPRKEPTGLGGYTIDVPVHPFEGVDAVGVEVLGIRYMGPQSQRKDWYIRAQRPLTAYPLWRPGRAFVGHGEEAGSDFLVLIRDENGALHARWLRSTDMERVPATIAASLRTEEVGVIVLSP